MIVRMFESVKMGLCCYRICDEFGTFCKIGDYYMHRLWYIRFIPVKCRYFHYKCRIAIVLCVPGILYSLLSTSTNAQLVY